MKWYDDLYVGESIVHKTNKIKWKIRHNAGQINIYVITLASGEKNLLDIIPSHELLQKGYPKKQLYVIGLAKGYDEAVEVAHISGKKGGEKQNDRRVTHNLKNHWDCAAGDSWNHAFSAGSLIVCTGTLFRERNS